MERELAEPETARTNDSIAAAIAHEVNNLLTPVIGLADLLEHTEGDEEIRDQLIERAVERCQRAVTICALLMDIAKDDRASHPHCELSHAVQATISTAKSRADESEVRLEAGFDGPGSVAIPSAVVEHVFLNLVLNAIAASTPTNVVKLSASFRPASQWQGAAWTISVSDHGRGLEERNVRSINQGGLPVGSPGIGLAVVRLLCQRWGGKLRVESELGVGSTFHVELPAS